jgi:HEAT repeat protein
MTLVRRVLVFPFLFVIATAAPAQQSQVGQARSVLRDGLESNDFTIRIQAIQAAGLIGPNENLRHRLEEFLDDKKVEVRVAAIHTLADLKSTASIPALKNCIKQDDTPEVRFAAAKALYAFHDPTGEKELLDIYHGDEKATSGPLHSQARKFFGNFHSFESATTFIVSSGIGYVPVPGMGQGMSAVVDLLSDPDLSPRATALLLLARNKDPQSDLLIREALKDKDWSVRASAAQLIAYTARRDLRQRLIPLFSDKNAKVRLRAAGAYLHLAVLAKESNAAARL